MPGTVEADDTLRLVARPNPDWPLARVWRLLYREAPDAAPLREFAGLQGLSASWRKLALRRIETRAIEDWKARLGG